MVRFIQRLMIALFLVTATIGYTPIAVAQDEKQEATEETSTVKEAVDTAKDKVQSAADELAEAVEREANPSSLGEDLEKAREILMGSGGDNGFVRGMIIALLQPIFIASMFTLGLWAGQMSERLRHIWVLPVAVYAATFVGAFISVYHSDWKPQFEYEHLKFLTHLQSTEGVAVVLALVVGIAVALMWLVPPFMAMIGAVVIGLILGVSNTDAFDGSPGAILLFWSGFGLSGLLANIFGIGFETFFQSINLRSVARLVGAATAVLAVYAGATIF